jgi:hypothetical protein
MLGKFYHTTIEKTMSVNALSITQPNMAALSTRNSTLLPNALNAVNNTAKNIGKNVTVAANNVAVAANNAVKSVNTALNSSFTNMGNSFASAAKNTTKNLGLAPAVNTIQNATKNTGANIANSLKALNTSLSIPVEESIDAVPSEGLSLGVSLPLILSIGLLVILLVLFVVFRQQIAMAFQNAYDSVYNTVYGSSGTTPTPTPTTTTTTTDSSVTLEPGTEAQPIPPPEATESVISKVVNARKSVFNVATNKYTYADAEPLCKALGAELATYDQVKQAWDDGADWCNYGWVKGQTAIYPTQQKTFDKLQTASTDDERMACGLPGINGGYMDNPELRFGVNCYGDRPAEKDADIRNQMMKGESALTSEVLEQRRKQLRFRTEANEIPLNPYN